MSLTRRSGINCGGDEPQQPKNWLTAPRLGWLLGLIATDTVGARPECLGSLRAVPQPLVKLRSVKCLRSFGRDPETAVSPSYTVEENSYFYFLEPFRLFDRDAVFGKVSAAIAKLFLRPNRARMHPRVVGPSLLLARQKSLGWTTVLIYHCYCLSQTRL